jgi:parallel beta-helix repeat protein
MQAKQGGYSGDDNILLRKGQTFREQLTVPFSGTSGHPLTFGAYGTGAPPIITGFNVLAGFSDISPNVYQLTGVMVQPKVVAYNGTLLKYHHVTTAIGANEWDWASNILYINVGVDPSGGTVEAGAREYAIRIVNNDFITIDGLTMTGANIASVSFSTSSDSEVIKNCTVYNSFQGINAESDAGNNNIIQDNTIRNTVEYGILWTNRSATGTLIQGNNIHNVGGGGGGETNMQGMYLRIGSGTIVQNNTIYNCGDNFRDHGIYMGGSNGVIVRYNKIYNNVGWGVKVSDSGRVDVYHNILYGNGGGVIVEVGTPSYVNIYNNVIANGSSNAQGFRIDDGDHVTFKNNIIYNIYFTKWGDGTKYNLVYDFDVHCTITNFVSDYNVVYHPSPTAYYAWYNGAGHTWAEWQAHGLDAHSLNVDPIFVNATGNDFHLQPTSPAINAGTNVGLTQDYYGNSVPQGSAPDIGAHEFRATGLRPVTGVEIIK